MTESNVSVGRFPDTRWSLLGLCRKDVTGARNALEEVLLLYRPALRLHLLSRWRLNQEAAEDLLQGFIADKILQGRILERVQRERGRFRSYIRCALNNYVRSYLERTCRHPWFPLSDEENVKNGLAEDNPTSDAFSVSWAREVLGKALDRMEEECTKSSRPDLWGMSKARILCELVGEAPTPYGELVLRYRLESPSQASNLVITAKRMYQRHLRAIIETYSSDVDDEIADLFKILSCASAG